MVVVFASWLCCPLCVYFWWSGNLLTKIKEVWHEYTTYLDLIDSSTTLGSSFGRLPSCSKLVQQSPPLCACPFLVAKPGTNGCCCFEPQTQRIRLLIHQPASCQLDSRCNSLSHVAIIMENYQKMEKIGEGESASNTSALSPSEGI